MNKPHPLRFCLCLGLLAAAAASEALAADNPRILPERERAALQDRWLERRIPEEMNAYRIVNRIAHTILEEGLSEKAILPGYTSTADVQWWYRNRIRELGLDTWFHPSVSVQRRRPDGGHEGSFAARPGEETILPGDLLHVDFGITYLGLNTDTQRHAYVLRDGEREAPAGLPRPRGGAAHRSLGPAGGGAGAEGLPALCPHRPLDRAQRGRRRARVGRTELLLIPRSR